MSKVITCNKCDGYRYVNHLEFDKGEHYVWSEQCDKCNGRGFIKVITTNYDHIKLMSEDEIAEFIYNTYWEGYEDHMLEEYVAHPSFKRDINEIKEWMNMSVDDK